MKRIAILISAFLLLTSQYTTAQKNSSTVLRVDFFRCGNSTTDSIDIKEIFFQDNASLGPRSMIDTMNYGEYKIEVLSDQGSLLFLKGYSSMFNEWKTTEEAYVKSARFEESVLIPWDNSMSKIVFSMRDSLDQWHVQAQVVIEKNAKPKFYHMKKFPVKKLKICGAPEDKLDILFIPDGYTKKEMKLFTEDCRKVMSYIANAKPFNEFPDDINFSAVMAPSAESGTDFPHQGIMKNTLLNSTFNTFGTERYLTTFSYHAVMDVAASAPADHIIVLVNTDEYGGGGFYNFYTLAAAHNSNAAFLVQHELGHGLTGLGDEYYTSDVAYDSFYNAKVEPWEPNLTTLVDFSTKWDSLLAPDTPIPTPADKENCRSTGVFEGGGYSAKGIYRPACDCTMKSVIPNRYCEACKAAIRRTIHWYAL